ncbi:MAG TPA: ATP-dependent DNA helicase, partial [Dongiaceae bacterium]
MPDLLSPQPQRGGARAVLVAGFAEAAWLTPDGHVTALDPIQAARRALIEAPIVCHAPATFRKLKSQRAAVADILELYAFVRPASFCLPTPRGIALAMGLPLGDHAPLGDQARVLAQAARALLGELAATTSKRRRICGLANLMAKAGWVWGPDVLKALEAGGPLSAQAGVAVWEDLPEWQDQAPEPAP